MGVLWVLWVRWKKFRDHQLRFIVFFFPLSTRFYTSQVVSWISSINSIFSGPFWGSIQQLVDLDLRKMPGKSLKYSPNGGLMVIYHGTKQKNTLNKSKLMLGPQTVVLEVYTCESQPRKNTSMQHCQHVLNIFWAYFRIDGTAFFTHIYIA